MGWRTVDELIQDKINQGELPEGHRLLGYTITDSAENFAKDLPVEASSPPEWTPSIDEATLVPNYEHAVMMAKILRGRFRPAVIVSDHNGLNRHHLYLPSDTEDTFKRPRTWKPLYQPQVEKYIQEGELPQSTKMKGYVIRLVASDEFLVRHTNDSLAEGWVWGLHPNQAKVFKDFSKACKLARRHKEADVFPLLDAGTHYFVFES
ncbi:hypothetical protein [Pseudomonas aeruginosa]|uniref:hypothetical protein n=1 Tax=Pseudomonas aeruginosa TaxID=287 RepID=UPI0011130BB0|nr:hypothetical protein [Pseudomonas aeruginosa]